MKNIPLPLIAFLTFFSSGCTSLSRTEIQSPDGNIRVEVVFDQVKNKPSELLYTVWAGGKRVLMPSSFEIRSPQLNTENLRITSVVKESFSGTWTDNFGPRKDIPDNYNEVKVFLDGGSFSTRLICRVYNEGVAFAYEFPKQEGLDSLTVSDEKFLFRFSGNHTAWSAARAQAQYSKRTVSTIEKGCERPLVIEYDSTLTIALAEAKLVDYARMKFETDSSSGTAIRSRLDGIVKKKLPFQSPWRVVMIGKNPGDLLEKNYLLLNLNDPSAIKDISWIKPGKVVREVTLTTTGAKSLVDFISAHKMQYIEFDAGWYGYEYSDSSDARGVNVDPKRSKGPLDLQEVINYARAKDIGVILYVNRRALEKQLDEILPLYSRWGISGLKFGFVQVGTQPVTAWMHEAIRKSAAYKMVVDVHDEYRPTGFSRTYPNFLTQEGIRGDEESPSNSHTLITMFTRCLAGAADNTVCYYDNRVDAKMGSHASQMAKAVCIFSPLQFLYWYDRTVPAGRENELAGKPNYLGNEPELEFFDNLPTVWDETKVLSGIIGEYGVIARRKGEEWYIGGINGDKPREAKTGFSFLTEGRRYIATIYSDDPSVNTRTHVMTESREVNHGSVYYSSIGPNKGFAIRIVPAGE
jgi:alpha-glucosidase